MKNFLKKNIAYFITIGISLSILMIIFMTKKIYPFGNNTVIYSDMYDQLTSYYYYLYDCMKGASSIFLNLKAASCINFFGILCYYLLSPFTLLILFVERSKIYLFVSIIMALKLVVCNVTALYMMKKLFKNLSSYISVFLALFYGFSIFSLNYYIITSWIDAMYMLPLIIVGLKKLFDHNKPIMYIITLSLSLYFSFYITLMIIMLIFLLSMFYIKVYLPKKEFAKKILSLGISTVLSLGCSLVVIIPTYKQITLSSRTSYGLKSLFNSKLGPIVEKTSLFLFGSILFVGILLLLKDYKKHKKFLKMYIPSMLLLLIPVIIEPVNKLLHFGAYASLPYRFGFVTVLFLIIGAAYYFCNYERKHRKTTTLNKIISITLASFAIITTIAVTVYKYNAFQKTFDDLALSSNKLLFLLLVFLFVVCFLANLLIFILNKGFHKLSFLLIAMISLTHIFCTSYIYIGMDHEQEKTNNVYQTLSAIKNDKNNKEYDRYKNDTNYIINNSSNVTQLGTLDHFSSLTDGSNQQNLRYLGYTSYWTITFSKGGTLFSDILLGNKYLLNTGKQPYNYSFIKKYNDLSLYKYKNNISFGYLINKNIHFKNYDNTFDLQNAIYKSISKEKENLFETIDHYDTHNLEIKDNMIMMKDVDNYILFQLDIKKKQEIYFDELYRVINNSKNERLFELFDIYINDKLFIENYPNRDTNGVLDLGDYEQEQVNVKLVLKKDCPLTNIHLGTLDLEKLDRFIQDNYLNYDIEIKDNKINIHINSKEKKILFLPITYNDSFTLRNNKKQGKLIKIYDNYIGIPLEKGKNNITLTFTPQYLKASFGISFFFLLLTILLIKLNVYQKLTDIKSLQKIAKYLYLGIYVFAILLIYLLPCIGFLIF